MSREEQKLDNDAASACVSWTGGKDCNLALLEAWRNPSLNVESLVVFRLETNDFRAHPIDLMKEQADALCLPLHFLYIPKDTTDYMDAYVKAMKSLKEEHGIEVMVTGDMDLVGTMKRNWIEECGEKVGIRAWLPLWQADRATLLHQLLDENFHVVFSCVKSPWFDESWVGRRLDRPALECMEEQSKREAAFEHDGWTYKRLDLGGERGEYHTMSLNGPLYLRSVRIKDSGVMLRAQELDRPIEHPDDLSWWPRNQKWWALRRVDL